MADYGKVPSNAQIQPTPFKSAIPEEKLAEFKQLIKLSPIGPATYENQQADRRWGMNRQWLVDAKKYWESEYDWRRCEKHINSFPNFTIPIKDDDGEEFNVHFIALFSEKRDAVPLALFHGWPGSIIEFLGVLGLLKDKYSPAELPYHVIVPSLPGYAFSSGPPLSRDFTASDLPRIMNKLLVALGFGSGYVAQGGDIGSFIARQLGVDYEECKAVHQNMAIISQPENVEKLHQEEIEQKAMLRLKAFRDTGSAYMQEHATRTATIGLALSASPIALLSWIGEKFLEWTDEDPSLDTILDDVSLYWLTETYARCIYPYRGLVGRNRSDNSYIKKPFGFSWFPKEITPIPKSWIELTGDLVYFKRHEAGGHFAALEKPKELLEDVEEFVKQVWKKDANAKL